MIRGRWPQKTPETFWPNTWVVLFSGSTDSNLYESPNKLFNYFHVLLWVELGG